MLWFALRFFFYSRELRKSKILCKVYIESESWSNDFSGIFIQKESFEYTKWIQFYQSFPSIYNLSSGCYSFKLFPYSVAELQLYIPMDCGKKARSKSKLLDNLIASRIWKRTRFLCLGRMRSVSVWRRQLDTGYEINGEEVIIISAKIRLIFSE